MKTYDEVLQELLKNPRDNISVQDGIIVIDGDKIECISPRRIDDTLVDIENPEQYAMVHSTNFFPKNHAILTTHDGKQIAGLNGFIGESLKFRLPDISHRLTTHYTINAKVKDNDGGEWSNKDFCIIEPLKYHTEQVLSWNPSDLYTYGSVNLSDEAIVVVTEESINKIPEEERNKFHIILAKTNSPESFYNVINNVIELLGNKVHSIPNENSHSIGLESRFELWCTRRNILCNLITNDIGNKIEKKNFTEKEIAYLYHRMITDVGNSELNFLISLGEGEVKCSIDLPLLRCARQERV